VSQVSKPQSIRGNSRTLEATGVLAGLVDASKGRVAFEPVEFWDEDSETHFKLEIDVGGKPIAEIEALIGRIQPAIVAAVAAASGVAVEARLLGWSYPYPDRELRRVTSQMPIRWNVRVNLEPSGRAWGQAALEAVLSGADVRLPGLYDLYTLGVRAAQSIAPVVGLWAFSTLLEEDAPKGKHNLNHVPVLADQLSANGHAIPPMPSRNLDEIRASALHPTPKSPQPTAEEIRWFQITAGAYLRDRASRASRQSGKQVR
jgi:hypothetical protein